MIKYKVGDCIEYTPENEQEVIDRLLSEGESVFSAEQLRGSYYRCFVKTKNKWSRGFLRSPEAESNITDSFFDGTKELPEYFYIDTKGDVTYQNQITEWLESAGVRGTRQCHTQEGEDRRYWFINRGDFIGGVSDLNCIDKAYKEITPKLSTKTVEFISGFDVVEPSVNKELEELKASYKELGEKINAMESKL